ncbi:protein NRT1/ PTR FAMILY 3.1-like [Cornus florida]|uniref:protein NRT1/ PTR FAMILY 3.1-like n=1 Tax=Cornus florida TaxID=4283 RepID=UPI002896EE9B|nr:protein NRT1/ PTR FAMILY 3.1-like [Cornus florida]
MGFWGPFKAHQPHRFKKMAMVEKKGSPVGRTKGGLITMPFIFANEGCEKLAVVGFSTNMISYLTEQLHMPLTKAANTLTNFGGTASLTPLIGAFIADAYAGRFWTITVASMIYQIGMICLIISAVLPKLRPPPCKGQQQVCQEASSGQLAILYISLLLTALGSGGIRPCVVAFGADQFDETDSKQKTKTWKFFNWYYFCMGASILVAVTVIVYIQDNIGWGWGLGVPAIAMALSVIAFIIGYPLYRNLDPAGSPFTRLVQVCVAAFKKRNLQMVSDQKLLYENEELDASISVAGKLLHTKHMKFLDKAAIVTEEDNITSSSSPNLWRLNTVHRVEELKSVIRMGPIWAAGILLITAYAQQNTFSLQQAKTMDRHLANSFQIPAGSMTVFTMTFMLSTIVFYDRVFVPIARRFTGLDRGITFLQRMGIGFVISVLATLVAGFVEVKRKRVASTYGLTNRPHAIIPISVFWLVPQYALHGMAEAFMSIGHLEFFYDQAPESMKSTASALFWMAIAAGSYLSTFLVTAVHKYSAGPGGSNWLPDTNLNEGKLEYFYWLITALQVINLFYYLCCAKFYTFKPVQIHNREDGKSKGGEIELGDHV